MSILDFPFDFGTVGTPELIDPAEFPPCPKIRILSDEDAMAADWRAVGDDIRAAMDQYERK